MERSLSFNEIRAKVREKQPLIHCITNPISINQCANVILAVGARPIMAEHPKEVAEISSGADALLLNLGNITDITITTDRADVPAEAMTGVVPGAEIYVPLDELVDFEAEYERLKKEQKKLEGEVKRVKGMLSNEGFVKKAPEAKVQEEKDKDGRVRSKAVYKGLWTVLREPGRPTRARLWIALALAFALAGVYVRTLLVTHASSGQILVMLPILIGLFPLLYLLMGALSLPFRGRPMRRDQYMHSFIRVFRSCVAVGAFLLTGLLASFIYRIVKGDWLFLSGDWRFLAGCVAALALDAAIFTILRGVDLTEKPNSACESRPL